MIDGIDPNMIKCSVCIATYNGRKFILEQLLSILNDLKCFDEIIIFDDCSTDDTYDILKSISDNRIIINKNKKNIGVIKTFEKAIIRATGKVIFFCDQDDIWYVGKRDEMVNAVYEENVLVAVSDCNVIDEAGNVIMDSYFKYRNSKAGFINNIIKNSYLGCSMCFRSDFRSWLLPFPRDISMHDEWVGLLGDLVGNVKFVPKQLFGYRRHAGNVTKMRWGGVIYAIKKRVLNILTVFLRLILYSIKKPS